MNIQHVEMLNKLAAEILASPPIAILVEDREGDFINFGGVLISNATYEQDSISGTVKSSGYAVAVEVCCPGSYWEPPSAETADMGVYPVFTQAIARVIFLITDQRISCGLENATLDESFQEASRKEKEAWAAGYKGYKEENKGQRDNPYPEGTDLHKLWLAGWGEGECEACEAERIAERRRED
jgi:hypothetical protein